MTSPAAAHRQPRIVVCGEALFDVFAAATTPQGLTLDARLGGSAFNLAVGLARLGRRVALLTGVSTDPLGARILAALRAEGVETDLIVRRDAPVTLALVTLGDDGAARYAFHGHGAADRAVTAADLPQPGPDVAALAFGCFSLLTRPTGDSFLALAQAARGGPLVALDPNLRLAAEPDAALWRARVAAFAACADLIKLSAEDMATLYPGADPAAVARGWLDGGAALVALTRGADGATAWTAAHTVHAPAPGVAVADTIGAGDGFLAALLAALAETGALRRARLASLSQARLAAALDFATQAAARACARRGADLARRAELPPLAG